MRRTRTDGRPTSGEQGVVHRDLKPANIFLVRTTGASTVPVCKLLDFGLAKMSVAAAPGTIETRLATSPAPGLKNCLAAHPAVFEAAVVAVPDERWGEVPKALVVLKPGLTATEEELVQHCKANLAAFKVPKSIDFRATLPKGGTGKILKAELREPFWKSHAQRVHQEYNRADRPRLRLIPPRD